MVTRNDVNAGSSSMDVDPIKPSVAATISRPRVAPTAKEMQDSDLDAIFKGGMLIKTYDGTSQYTQQGVSACGLASFNAVRCVLLHEQEGVREEELLRAMMSHELVQDVTSICTSWTSAAHLEVDEIYNLPLYSQFLQVAEVRYGQPSFEWFMHSLEKLEGLGRNGSNGIIFTKPPEILCVLRISMDTYDDVSDVWVVFDSHSRPPLHPNGAAFSFFGTMRGAAEYLAELLSSDSTLAMDPTMQWQAQLLSQISAHIITTKNTNPLDSDAMTAIYDASVTILQVKSELADLQMTFNNLQESHKELAKKNKRLDGENSRLSRELAETRESMTVLLQHQESREYDRNGWTSVRRDDKGKGKEKQHSHYPEDNYRSEANYGRNNEGIIGKASKAAGVVADYFLGPTPAEARDDPTPPYGHKSSSKSWSSRHQSDYGHKDGEKRSSNKLAKPEGAGKTDRDVATKIQTRQDHDYALRLQQDLLAQERRDAEFAASLQRDFDDERLRLSQDEALVRNLGHQATFDCCICMDTHPEDSVANVEPCGHRFCRPCIKSYVSSKLEENTFPIICPLCTTASQESQGLITGEFIEIIGVSEEDFIKYNQLGLSKYSILLECRKCKKSVNVDKEDHKAATIITCPVPGCRGMWCRECSQFVDDADGANHSCDGTKELDRLLASQKWKRCPGCTTPVEKTEGCNHMTCGVKNCNTHFCWIDGAKIIQTSNTREAGQAVKAHYNGACAGQLFHVPAEA